MDADLSLEVTAPSLSGGRREIILEEGSLRHGLLYVNFTTNQSSAELLRLVVDFVV